MIVEDRPMIPLVSMEMARKKVGRLKIIASVPLVHHTIDS